MIVSVFCPDCLHLRDRVWGCPTCNYTGWVDSVVPMPSDSDEDDLLEDAESVEPAPADEGGKRRDYTTTPLNPADVREVISTPPPADCRICGATPPCVICYDLHEQPTPPPALPAGVNPCDIPAQAFPYTYIKAAAIGGRDVSLIYARHEAREKKRAIRAGVLAPHLDPDFALEAEIDKARRMYAIYADERGNLKQEI